MNHQNTKSIFTVPGSFNERPNQPPPSSNQSSRATSPFRRLSTPEYNETLSAVNRAPAPTSTKPTSNPSSAVKETNHEPVTRDPVPASGRPNSRGRSLSHPTAIPKEFVKPAPRQPSIARPPTTTVTPPNPKKRAAPSFTAGSFGNPFSEPSQKKARLQPRTKHTLDQFNFSGPSVNKLQPPSPLFFSNTPRARPQLPARFSSSEASARMLSQSKSEDSHVKTVSLVRGTITTPSIPTSAPARRSVDRSATGRSISPDVSMKGDLTISVLSNIGIIELLEQDERPTLIIDLSNSQNYGAGPLFPMFSNSALRSYQGLLDVVTGVVEDESPGSGEPRTHVQFKSWLLSAAVNGESLNVCLPSFIYAGMSWSCSTLRKRLRIVSGSYLAEAPRAPMQTYTTAIPTIPPIPTEAPAPHLQQAPIEEPQDYFGSAAPPPTSEPSVSGGEIIASTEISTGDSTGTTIPDDSFKKPNSDPSSMSIESYSQVGENALQAAAASNVDWIQIPAPISPESASFDWTRIPVSDAMPRHIQFARSIDWASTSLGPIELWPSDLRQMCNLIMASPHPAAMYWGEDLVAIYNEAYTLLAGQKHPKLMGQSYAEAWAEIWDEVKEVFATAKHTGEATMKDDDCLFIKRNDYLEETYFSWSIIPMVGEDGTVMGLYNPAFEKTRRKIAERRMLTLREIGERTAVARDVKGFWQQVLGALEFNEYDTPFVLLYSVGDESDSDTSSIHSNSVNGTKNCNLEGALGVPEGHPAATQVIDLKTGIEGFGPVFREVLKTDKPVLLEFGTQDLPSSLLEKMEWRGFGDPCRAVVVCPIHPTTGDSVLGFLVLGVNPRRPYDDDYSLFVQLLSRQMATSLASVVLFEEEIRRGQRAAKLAALDRIELSEQLAQRTQEAIENETKFTRMAQLAPVGMFIADSEGRITYCNDTWFEVSRVSREEIYTPAHRWMDAVKDEDISLVKSLWNDLVQNKQPVTGAFRFKAPWEDRDGSVGERWVLFSAYPEKYGSGALKSVFGSLTDISKQKWAEGFQKRKMEEAVELKRQQENFIDITSHEMRNPLSAILQCADEISTTMNQFRNTLTLKEGNTAQEKQEKLDSATEDVVASTLDAAQTIALCAQHQKRIVDDILTLSKLDSQLLLVTPVDAQPLTVVQRALKMHEGELQTADIQLKFIVDESYKSLSVDWVRFDPSRVLQVLINLTTNAIKFTTTERKRTITVTLAASREKPNSETGMVNYFPTRSKRNDMFKERDWGEGEELYIHFAVQDTGRGLNDEEKKLLFLRFSQASPRTHVQYGGSGLGLFISRELTELQGGEIGVASEAGKGSTFAFYVRARRSATPANADGGPLSRVASDAQGKKLGTAKAGAAGKASLESPRADRKIKVLIVEDNLVNQRVLQKQLKNLGCVVHVANHGGEALDQLRRSNFWDSGKGDGSPTVEKGERIVLSVVLMDQEMPVMDGLTCTRKIREFEKEGRFNCHVPVIAVTANARSEQIQTALDAGMDDVVSKPFRIPDLIPKIEELMDRYPEPPPPAS